ncbi:hypothetical protein [Sulfurirhabdus autotrophica]|uniref:Protein involved in plasmid replication-relaxation n=1 Tax=Sulfurirhabdus autotrophica TaxID=1706046 RepID=A0A4R3Y2A6_9PROT|nr:hypothetical protein [Sulfurirhabdus autotrophica]TCV85826.1 hypothetical protein EDC63_10834 [Sulfurirhabdus autotrophica]
MDIQLDTSLDDFHTPSRIQGQRLELDALHLLHRFGWLRAREVGILLYSSSNQSRTLAERLLRRLVEKRQIFFRPLQGENDSKHARAYLLGQAGADRLWEVRGIDAWTSKDITISSTWLHDLIAHQILAKWKNKGFQIVTGRELHRRTRSGMKIPDGLAKPPGQDWIWLEVERSRKSGPAIHKQAKYLAGAALGMEWLGYQLGRAVVAYPETPGVNHRLRNISALSKLSAPSPFKVIFFPLKIHPLTLVVQFGQAEEITIEP